MSSSVHAGIPHPPGADTPQSRLPQSRHPHPRADTSSPGAVTPTPGADTPQSRHLPQEQTPPKQTPPWSRHPPPCRACWEIRSTRGRYASYWNAILLHKMITLTLASQAYNFRFFFVKQLCLPEVLWVDISCQVTRPAMSNLMSYNIS